MLLLLLTAVKMSKLNELQREGEREREREREREGDRYEFCVATLYCSKKLMGVVPRCA